MDDSISRRDALKVIGVAGAGALVPSLLDASPAAAAPPVSAPTVGPASPGVAAAANGEIVSLSSTSEVFIPPKGRSFVKFSFDFPEPSVAFEGLRFGVIVFTHENALALDPKTLTSEPTADGIRLTSKGLTWAGGQERTPGTVVLDLHKVGDAVEWTIAVTCDKPIKSVTTVVRGVPRGKIASGGDFFDPQDNEILFGYPFSGGDLFGPGGAWGMNTPLVMVKPGDGPEVFFASSRDDQVGAKRFFFQPGESGYRLECVWEAGGWTRDLKASVPAWRVGRAATPDAAMNEHYEHIDRAHHIPDWDTRTDVPDWMRTVALVTTLHGQHYTGYIFNDYARMLEIARWMATQIPPERVLLFLSSWDGRYYWDYPNYTVNDRMGGEAGFRRLIDESHALGFKVMPMFGANAANRNQPVWRSIAAGATAKIDGDQMDINWVDWDNDRHQDGWLTYMNLGAEPWRRWLGERIADMIARYGVDAYFLDIVGGWTNNTKADMHEGTRRLVADLRAKYPKVLCVGEMHYDALLEFIPVYHAGGGGAAKPYVQKHARFFQHLSHPAPGRGSTGVHEAGFGDFDPKTLSLSPSAIPTLNVVDDTFDKYRDVMAAVIAKAKERAGIP